MKGQDYPKISNYQTNDEEILQLNYQTALSDRTNIGKNNKNDQEQPLYD
ncbi:MAG: hypothetical protein ACMG6E_08485 [Candidatus Roizmanbacteria bacterium]